MLLFVPGTEVVLGHVALFPGIDRAEMPRHRHIPGFRLLQGQMAVMRRIGLSEMLLPGQRPVFRLGRVRRSLGMTSLGMSGRGWSSLGMRGDCEQRHEQHGGQEVAWRALTTEVAPNVRPKS